MQRTVNDNTGPTTDDASIHQRLEDEDGSLVSEYGLLAILGATIVGLAIKWASGGAIFSLFGAVFDKVRVLVGA
ncbi:MAG: hypothetical protein R3343_05580 [Nitriliruptorales bacterium]|nr:hypothetical protein [Nitriliruptorales bacterium]